MNILLLTNHLNPGGLSRYVISLARGLRANKHRVFVASSGGAWIEKLENSGIGHIKIPLKTKSIVSPRIYFSFLKLKKLLLYENIDIIQANTRITQSLAALISRKSKIPYVSAFHGFYKPHFFRKLMKFGGRAQIAVSKAVKRHLIEDLGFNPENIKVVYNGIDLREFPKISGRRQDFEFKPDDYLVGMLGRISEEKGYFLAAQAMAGFCAKYPKAYFLVSGKGKKEQELKQYLRQLGIESRARFIKAPPNEFLSLIDLLLVPSQKEGFGYSIIEAFSKGVPVIAYDTGAIPEIIESRKNGLLFRHYRAESLLEAIDELFQRREFAAALAARAKQSVSNFLIEKTVINTEKAYWGVLK